MKKSGFTLIELLAVIIILSIIATIAVPSVINVVNTSRQKACERQKDMIIDAAKRWGSSNINNLKESKQICINQLQKEGYLSSGEILNPKTKKTMDGCINITYDETYHQYEYTYKIEPCR